MITQQRLKEVVHYNPTTGIFTNKVSYACRREGTPWGSKVTVGVHGYKVLRGTIDGISYILSRLAFLYMGVPISEQVDHKDRDTLNNSWANLRACTNGQNTMNQAIRLDNNTGVKGVTLQIQGEQAPFYRARITFQGTTKQKSFTPSKSLTKLQALEDATAWVQAKRLELHKEFANNG